MWFAATFQVVSSDYLIFGWIYLSQIISTVYGNEDVFGDRIILRVSGAAAESNGRHALIGVGIDYCVCLAMQIGDVNLIYLRSIGNTIGIVSSRRPRDDLQSRVVDDSEFVCSGSGSINAMKFRDGQDPMHS